MAAIRETDEEVNIPIKNIKNHGNILHAGEHKVITLWVFSAEAKTRGFKIDNFARGLDIAWYGWES